MAKKLFDVCVQEIWNRGFIIEAETEREAREIANNLIESGDSEGNFEYSHTLDTDEWSVADISDQVVNLKNLHGIVTRIDNSRSK
jgi:hypothetical protein